MAVTKARSAEAVITARARRRSVARQYVRRALTYLGILLVVALFVIPFLWMIVTSLKTPEALGASGISWIPQPVYVQNYADALTMIPYLQYLGNTLAICIPNVVGTVLSCSLAAYALACVRWPGRGVSFGIVTSTRPARYECVISCALAQAVPGRVSAAEGATSFNFLFGGVHPETGIYYTNYHIEGSGWGGTAEHDGNDAQCPENGNCPAASPKPSARCRIPSSRALRYAKVTRSCSTPRAAVATRAGARAISWRALWRRG